LHGDGGGESDGRGISVKLKGASTKIGYEHIGMSNSVVGVVVNSKKRRGEELFDQVPR
jgi:hypothetical protein